ncbi:hypothetical protein CC80DRAFT_143057 [Byssothecium circinans]|uniref:Uncharacterized protein n=1 Tax=Byssothecium circinans TaxID=147558 RepID=A0A6A5TL97_9PLEO|nr:hypothetical protein CC80DRAFT_143057 [Byssothecium circinans]
MPVPGRLLFTSSRLYQRQARQRVQFEGLWLVAGRCLVIAACSLEVGMFDGVAAAASRDQKPRNARVMAPITPTADRPTQTCASLSAARFPFPICSSSLLFPNHTIDCLLPSFFSHSLRTQGVFFHVIANKSTTYTATPASPPHTPTTALVCVLA